MAYRGLETGFRKHATHVVRQNKVITQKRILILFHFKRTLKKKEACWLKNARSFKVLELVLWFNTFAISTY